MPELIVERVSKDSKGFLRRQREALYHQEQIKNNPTVQTFDAWIDWLMSVCKVQTSDGSDPREALLDLSETEYNELMKQFRGDDAEAVPTKNGS
jgi:glycerol kinase